MPALAQLSDPFALGAADDPYPWYAALRETAPVYRHPVGFWVITRYDDVNWLLRAPMSSEEHNVTDPRMKQARQRTYGDRDQYPRPLTHSMLLRDPPDHTRLRRLVYKAFTRRTISGMRQRITEKVDGMLDDIEAAERVDLVEALAFPMPFTVLAEMLGTPPADHARIQHLSGMLVRSLEPVSDPELARQISTAYTELMDLVAGMIAWKRQHPAEDLLTALIEAEDGGDTLSDDELTAQAVLLYGAGHESTTNLIAGGIVSLLEYPDQLAMLRRDPALIDNAVEELLRHFTPVQLTRRITLEPVTIRDVEIPQGQLVVGILASANRDEHFWGPDAAELRLNRENPHHHLAFGGGPHHCLGAALAKLEVSIALERLVTRFPRLALDGDVPWKPRINLRGPVRVPITVR